MSDPRHNRRFSPESLLLAVVALAFALVIFPFCIASHCHLYADGAPMLLSVLLSQETLQHAARLHHHLLTQGPVVLAMRTGIISGIDGLSHLHGFLLFYLPLTAAVAATFVLIRRRLPAQALLLFTAYCCLQLFCGLFPIGEFHLNAALFLLQGALLLQLKHRPRPTLIALILLALLATRIYESNLLFTPLLACALLLQIKTLSGKTGIILAVTLLLVYAASGLYAGNHILFSEVGDNRDGLLRSMRTNRWNAIPAIVCGGTLLLCLMHRSRLLLILLPLCAAFIAFAALFGLIPALPPPSQSYLLRTWAMLLPAFFFALALATSLSQRIKVDPAILRSWLLCIATLAGVNQYAHTKNWNRFTHSIRQTQTNHSGFVDVRKQNIEQSTYGWYWTYPSLSILLAAADEQPVTCILDAPDQPQEPYGRNRPPDPSAFQRAGIPLQRP